jgi:hypothetical protein
MGAATYGHLGVLVWLYHNGRRWDVDRVCRCAAARGHLSVMDWCISQGMGCVDIAACTELAHNAPLRRQKTFVERMAARWQQRAGVTPERW